MIRRLASLALVLGCAHSEKAGPPLAPAVPTATQGAVSQPPASPQQAAPPQSAASQAAPAKQPQPSLMPDEAFRAGRPGALERPAKFDAPVPAQRKLKNGTRVLVATNHATPLVAVDVRFLHGTDTNPAGKPGLAEFAVDAAQEATRKRPARKLARDIEDLAARLATGTAQESSWVRLNCLTETLPKALELLGEVVVQPAFAAADVERIRALRLAALEQKKATIALLARDEANRILYGAAHPWGQPEGGTTESVQAITTKDLLAWHDAWWVPGNAVIGVAGDIEPDEAVRLLDTAFAGWKAKAPPRLSLPAVKAPDQRFVSGLERPGATQSQVWVVGPLFAAREADAIPLRVANYALGGLFTSRLNLNLREKHGYSYGVFSNVQLGRSTGAFFARGGIVAKSTAPAIAEYEKELEQFATGDLSEVEFSRSRDMFVRGLPALLETDDAVSQAITNLVSLGLPLDYYRTLPEKAQALTREEVAAAVKKWMHPERWPVVVVGAVDANKEAIEKLQAGRVEVRATK